MKPEAVYSFLAVTMCSGHAVGLLCTREINPRAGLLVFQGGKYILFQPLFLRGSVA